MRIKAMLVAAMYSLALLGLMSMLTGCEAASEIGRAAYHACKDGHCG